MGLRNLRAICPNCGGKIHTQPKGIGHITWANSWFSVKTGEQCQWCNAKLTGKVNAGGQAELAPVVAAPAKSRYRVLTPDGRYEEFDSSTKAEVFKAVNGGQLQKI
jgi:hypothetical protein